MRWVNLLHEDEVTDKFGKLAFGDNEYTAKLQGRVKPEPNTEIENELVRALSSWVKKSGTLSANKIHSHKELLKKAAVKFPKILKPKTPNGTELYRGLHNIQNKTILQILKSTKQDWSLYDTIKGVSWWKSESITIDYKPHKNVQSWTSDFWVAADFSNAYYRAWTKYPSTMLLTLQNDEFFFNQELMQYLAPMDYEYEKEVLHIGKEYANPIYILINEAAYVALLSSKSKEKKK